MTFGVAVDKPDANIAMQKTKSVLIIFLLVLPGNLSLSILKVLKLFLNDNFLNQPPPFTDTLNNINAIMVG
jgi:hypothetical protein